MRVTGTVLIRMNGRSLRSKPGATLSMGGFERTDQYADHELLGYSQKPIASSITATLAHTIQTDLQAIMDAVSVTLVFETDTGKKYTIRNAFCTKPPELSGDEGGVAIEFKGPPAIEST
jgi:hypothetical protein